MSQPNFGPGSTIGIVGGGQLGRMLAAAARRCGYRVHVLTPEPDPPAGAHANLVVTAAYDDVEAVAAFASGVDVLTFEFENVSSAALAAAAAVTVVRPSPAVLHVTQDREREKKFLRKSGLPLAPFSLVSRPQQLAGAVAEVGTPCIVKSASFGYDGKGQVVLAQGAASANWHSAQALAAAGPVVVERRIELALELSVVAARSPSGAVATYAPIVNRHVDQILDVSLTPELSSHTSVGAGADIALPTAVAELASSMAGRIVDAIDLVGLCCVEFFLSRAGELLVNEIAPRPHNSGHLTIEAAATDQFEQQLRAVCGLPLGSTTMLTPAAMANLLGDLWHSGTPDFAAALATRGVTLHLYGKSEPRPGRKMGHLTAIAADVGSALAAVTAARAALSVPRLR